MKLFKCINSKMEEIICNGLLAFMLIILSAQVISRFVFNNSNAWSEELARYLFIWFIFIGASYAAQKYAHIKIDALINVFPKKLRTVVKKIGVIVWISFNIIVIVISFKYVLVLYNAGQVSLGLKIKMAYVYAAIPVGYALMTIRLIPRLFYNIKE